PARVPSVRDIAASTAFKFRLSEPAGSLAPQPFAAKPGPPASRRLYSRQNEKGAASATPFCTSLGWNRLFGEHLFALGAQGRQHRQHQQEQRDRQQGC